VRLAGQRAAQARHRDEAPPLRWPRVAIDSEELGIAALMLGAGGAPPTTRSIRRPAWWSDAYLGELIEPGAPPQVILCHNLAPGSPGSPTRARWSRPRS